MAGNITMGLAGPQDLLYGFDPKNVVESLTNANWKRKAVMRQDRQGLLYVWMAKGKQMWDGKVVHIVKAEHLEGDGGRDYGRTFDTLEDALRYANGEDGSIFSRRTRAMGEMILNERGARLFGAKPAPAVISMMGVGHKVEIPGPEGEGGSSKPDMYACFLTKVLESILALSPGVAKHVYKHGITLHPGVEGRRSYGLRSDLPERITVRCYKSRREVAARFHVFPKVSAGKGLIRAVRIDGPGGKSSGTGVSGKRRDTRR